MPPTKRLGIAYHMKKMESPIKRYPRALIITLLIALVLSVAFGCGGSTNFSAYDGLNLSRDRVELVRDEVQPIDAHLQLARGETRGMTVSLSVTGLPAGVTGVFTPATFTLNDSNVHTVRLLLTADRAVAPGEFKIVVHRTGGEKEHTKGFTLRLFDFGVKVDVDDNDVTLNPGDSQEIDITLTRRGNSNGTVELTLGGDLPDGVRWSISPARVTIDLDNPRRRATLTLEADFDADRDGDERCRVRALKGVNSNESEGIDVKLDVS